jgi:hypothetical protein
MSTLNLPTNGQPNWGTELNTAVQQSENDAQTAITSINNHTNNSPADPHGDRAFAQALINPLIFGANQANGFVQLDATSHIPQTLIPLSLPLHNSEAVSNSNTELMLAQFAIPSGDWTAGTYNYEFKVSGLIGWASAPALTIKWRLGSTGALSDTQFAGSLTPTLTGSVSQLFNVIGAVGIDSLGNWWPVNFAFNTNQIVFVNLGTNSAVQSSGIVYVTITAQWGTASVSNALTPKVGYMTRVIT